MVCREDPALARLQLRLQPRLGSDPGLRTLCAVRWPKKKKRKKKKLKAKWSAGVPVAAQQIKA